MNYFQILTALSKVIIHLNYLQILSIILTCRILDAFHEYKNLSMLGRR